MYCKTVLFRTCLQPNCVIWDIFTAELCYLGHFYSRTVLYRTFSRIICFVMYSVVLQNCNVLLYCMESDVNITVSSVCSLKIFSLCISLDARTPKFQR